MGGEGSSLTAWAELLDEFRALGGTADNIRLGQGEFGRGLFPIDPAKPVAIRIPENLLIPVEDMIFPGAVPRVGPQSRAGERERAWLNRYQEEFAWGEGHDEILRKFELARALPEELRQTLSKEFRCGAWFDEPTDKLIRRLYFQARAIAHNKKIVVMPLIEMANYGLVATYGGSDSVELSGTFPGEILVQYSHEDAFGLFMAFGFTAPCTIAFSIPLTGNFGSTRLTIRRQFTGGAGSPRDWVPHLSKEAGEGVLMFLMVGNEHFPRLSKGIFFRLMREGGYTAFEEAFDVIHHHNQLHFIKLLDALEGVDLPMAATLRSMARYQLRAISFCFGVREI
jgi:hypothetical protein